MAAVAGAIRAVQGAHAACTAKETAVQQQCCAKSAQACHTDNYGAGVGTWCLVLVSTAYWRSACMRSDAAGCSRLGCPDPGLKHISWPHEFAPGPNSARLGQHKCHDGPAGHELHQSWVEGLALVLSIKLFCHVLGQLQKATGSRAAAASTLRELSQGGPCAKEPGQLSCCVCMQASPAAASWQRC